MLSKDNQLQTEHIFWHLQTQATAAKDLPPGERQVGVDDEVFELPLTEAKQAFEKVYLERLLANTEGNIAEASRRCGRYRVDIYRLLDKYGIDKKNFR